MEAFPGPPVVELPGKQKSERHDGDGNESQDCEVSAGKKLNLAAGLSFGGVKSKKAVYCGGDDHDQTCDDGQEKKSEGEIQTPMAAKGGIVGKDTPGQYHVDDKDNNNAGGSEDIGGDSDVDVGQLGSPDDPQDKCDNTS